MSESVAARPSLIHGTGVFASSPIGAGTRIGRYEGSPTTRDGTHVLWVEGDGDWEGIDGTGVLRYLNHSATPNAEFDGPDLYALVDIEADDEILIDYGEDWADVP